ncbi:MAG TPA: acetate kinase [Firmicutes bacterium]|nr:acetate kinase [Bacillota bacterium]
MKVLVINCGSSSLKYQVFDMETETVLAKGNVERIGIDNAFLKYRRGDEDSITVEAEIPNHEVAIQLVFDALTHESYGVLKSVDEIEAVGHRVVHAGEKYASSVVINDDVMAALRECIDLAPLHNPPNIMGIEVAQKLMPNVKHVGVFDTAFHQTMPDYAYMYALPYELYEKYRVRRYGFHGTSHKYVSQRAAAILGRPIEELKIITCHLGNGASVTAVNGGKSVDTSMGFTPLEGLIMGTRSGDVDPAVVTFIQEKEGLSGEQVNNLLNKKSGVLGISGVSSDFRSLEEASDAGNDRATLAMDMFAYRVRKYIGAYAAAMGGVDAIVFTAGLGENSAFMREKICAGLEFLGVKIDAEKNNVRGREVDFSAADAKVRTVLVPTNEELMIARDTVALVRG